MGELIVTGKGDFLKFLQPAGDLSEADIASLKYLVQKYPYCQPLHFAYATALQKTDPGQYDMHLLKASAYAPKREVLHRFIYSPATFLTPGISLSPDDDDISSMEQLQKETTDTTITAMAPDNRDAEKDLPETVLFKEEGTEAAITYIEEAEDIKGPIETVIPVTEHLIEDTQGVQEYEPEDLQTISPDVSAEIPADEKIIVESIASSDYFVFNRSAIDPLQDEDIEAENEENENADAKTEEEAGAEVSKYDDDTLPYSFLWWLHKTRKEYEKTYRPYVKAPSSDLKKAVAGELNQQIIENIFHIQPELNTLSRQPTTTIEFELKKKDDGIIEKFIKEEPQIKPPQANKLNTENKARKSSEDSLELVTETLAKIYTDQMLYHKAIEIYKKLSLKFPDKKLYFAGQIQDLEKKIS